MKEVISNSVHELRHAKRITQEELGRALGVTRQTVIAIERGNYTPSVLLVLKIAEFFKKSVEEIFYLEKK